MNVFSKITLQGLKRNRTRTIVTIVGVILSASMLMAVTSFISSLQTFLLQSTIERDGDWHGKFYNVDSGYLQKLEEDKNVANTAVTQNIGYALLDGGQNEYKPYLFIAGFSDEAFDTLPVKLTEGRLPETSGEIIIPEHVKTNGGVHYKIGDVFTMEVGKRTSEKNEALSQSDSFQSNDESIQERFQPETKKTYTVVGIYERPTFENTSAPGYTSITRVETEDENTCDVYIKLNSIFTVVGYMEENAAGHHYALNNDYLRFSGASDNDNFNTVLYSLGAILIVLIMIGSVLLIYNSFSISVSERTRQFGILSSVGATKKQLRKSVLFEGACIGVIGIPLGILAGIGGIGITLKVVSGIFKEILNSETPLTLSVSFIPVAATVLLGIAVILISAFIPAKRATKHSAIESIRQTSDIKISARALKTSKLTQRLFGLEGMLARKNFKRNKKRYRTTVISLFVSVMLFISASAFGQYLKQGSEMSFAEAGYDLAVSISKMDDVSLIRLYDQLKTASGVYESGYRSGIDLYTKISPRALSDRYKEQYQLSDDDLQTGFEIGCGILFIDDVAYLRYLADLKLPVNEYTGAAAKLPAYAGLQGYDYESERVISLDMFQGIKSMSLTLTPFSEKAKNGTEAASGTPKDAQSKTIAIELFDTMPAGFSKSHYAGLTMFAPYSMKEHFNFDELQRNPLTLTFLSEDPMKSAAEMEHIIKASAYAERYVLYNAAEVEQANRNVLLVINIFAYGFIILMSLITIANVFNTISTNINLRRREFAMLKSVGLTERGFGRMMIYECIFYGLKALLYGLPISAGVTYLIFQAVDEGADVPFTLPWMSMGISVLGVFFVVFVTMLYSISKVKKENTVDALKNDVL